MPRLPFQILVFPYRVSTTKGRIEYALFKRKDLNFWQGIAGGGEENETPLQAAKREVLEESGIPMESDFIKLDTVTSIPITGFKDKHLWKENPYVILEYSFGVNAAKNKIKLSKEHVEYKWLHYFKAIKYLKWDSNKTALWELNCRLMNIDPKEQDSSS